MNPNTTAKITMPKDRIRKCLGCSRSFKTDRSTYICPQCKPLDVRDNISSEAYDDPPIHLWFSLSYASYLTVPRSVLQSMPIDWQRKFVRLLEELDHMFDWRPKTGGYVVYMRNGQNHYLHDPLLDYERGRRRVEPRKHRRVK